MKEFLLSFSGISLKRILVAISILVITLTPRLNAYATNATTNNGSIIFNLRPIEQSECIFVLLCDIPENLRMNVAYQNRYINTKSSITYIPFRFVSESLVIKDSYNSISQIICLIKNTNSENSTRPQQLHQKITHIYQRKNQNIPILKNLIPSRNSFSSQQPSIISAKFSQFVNPYNLTITLDGFDITNQTSRNSLGFSYQPTSSLQQKKHVVNVIGDLLNDHRFNESWTFTLNKI